MPDLRGRLPGRGASVHPDPACLDLAERRRAFPRALRTPGPLDASRVRRWVEEQAERQAASGDTPATGPHPTSAPSAVPTSREQSRAMSQS